jgi:UDP-N-acetyl-D-glucosamine dehydrogenase
MVVEIVQLLKNTFRAVNFAMINEMLLICEKLSLVVWEVIAAATKPFGLTKFASEPGIG